MCWLINFYCGGIILLAVGFLQSGSKLLFRRRYREKESCLSQSHEDLSNMSNNFAAAATSGRKKSGSFSRRLIKRFSFRTSGKSKNKASATNGGAGAPGNWCHPEGSKGAFLSSALQTRLCSLGWNPSWHLRNTQEGHGPLKHGVSLGQS